MDSHTINRYHLRKDFARIKKILDMPNLLDVQKEAYGRFLQRYVAPKDLDLYGLLRCF